MESHSMNWRAPAPWPSQSGFWSAACVCPAYWLPGLAGRHAVCMPGEGTRAADEARGWAVAAARTGTYEARPAGRLVNLCGTSICGAGASSEHLPAMSAQEHARCLTVNEMPSSPKQRNATPARGTSTVRGSRGRPRQRRCSCRVSRRLQLMVGALGLTPRCT
jgi:hypothetical protein